MVVRKFLLFVAAVFGAMLSAGSAAAAVKVHSLFTDNMVLQQQTTAPIWGTAAPGEKVEVALEGADMGQGFGVNADQDGKWMHHFKDLKAGGPFKLTIKGA